MNGEASAPISPLRPLMRRCLAGVRNAGIVLILLVVLIESCPAVPVPIRAKIHPAILAVGFNQGCWDMFAPVDRENHRIWVVVEFADGSRREWRPPEWRRQSRWERFVSFRQGKFAENLANPGYLAVVPSMAKWIIADLARHDDAPRAKPVRATFWVEEAMVPDPIYRPWPSVREEHAWDTKWQFADYDFEAEANQ